MRGRFKSNKWKGAGITVLIIVIILAVSVVSFQIYHFIQLNRMSQYTDVNVDGTVSVHVKDDSQKVLDAYQKASPASVISSDDTAQDTNVSIVFSGLNEDVSINEEVLRLLQENGMQATFAIPAVNVRENQGMIKKILQSGNRIISGGLNGKEKEAKDITALCDDLSKSKKIFDEETKGSHSILYSPGLDASLMHLKASKQAGYDQMVLADDNDLIDADTFLSETDVDQYVDGLQGKRILVIYLDGNKDLVHQEPTIVSAKPELDKQPDLDDNAQTKEEKPGIADITKWLLETVHQKNIQSIALSDCQKQPASTYIEKNLDDRSKKAQVYRSVLTNKKDVGLCIRHLKNEAQYEKVRSVLKQYDASASFFVSDDVDKKLAKRILKDGYTLENAGKAYADATKTYQEMEKVRRHLQDLDTDSLAYLVSDEASIDAIRRACFVDGQIPILPQDPKKLSKGSFYGYDASDLKSIEQLLEKAQQKEYKISDIPTLLDQNGTIPAFTNTQIQKQKKENKGIKATYMQNVSTTEPALALTFGNIGNEAVDLDVANVLKHKGAVGTFFVNFNEMREYTDTIETLIDQGQEIGISWPSDGSYANTYDGMATYIHDCLAYMEWRYNYQPRLVMLSKEPTNKEMLEAVHAAGLRAVGASKSLIQNNTQQTTEDQIPEVLAQLSNVRFTRGGLEYFNLGYYEADAMKKVGEKTLMGEVVSDVIGQFVDSIAFENAQTNQIEEESRYRLKTVSALLDSDQVYTVSKKKQKAVTLKKNVLTSMDSPEKQFAYMKDHYLGSNFIINQKKMPGFTDEEIQQMNKTGKLTHEKVIFLTFDDWGSDESVNKILYVLKKYHVKATFFVLTEHVDENPNLLRAIAEDGHEIGCHSNSHIALANANEDHSQYASLTKKEQKAMRKDLVTSYNKLNQYVGDVRVDGKKALSLDFRPPTLEISKEGLYQVFDVGFQYSISGDVTTNDYEITDLNKYIHDMTNGSPSSKEDYQVGNGSVIVMHMTEDAKYTAQMLDVMIPRWQAQGYRFARVDAYTRQYQP